MSTIHQTTTATTSTITTASNYRRRHYTNYYGKYVCGVQGGWQMSTWKMPTMQPAITLKCGNKKTDRQCNLCYNVEQSLSAHRSVQTSKVAKQMSAEVSAINLSQHGSPTSNSFCRFLVLATVLIWMTLFVLTYIHGYNTL